MERVDMFFEPVRAFLVQIGSYLPRLAIAVIVVLGGWLVAKALRFAVDRALRAINFHVLTERAGLDEFLKQGGMHTDSVRILAMLVYWIAILLALVIAFNGLGLTYITDLLTRVLLFLPRVMLALVILAFGIYFARFVGAALGSHLRNVGSADSELLGRLAQYAIVAFVGLLALDLLDIGGQIVRQTFLILLAGAVLALALAFGLGGQGWASALLERWWPTRGAMRRKEDRDGKP